MISLHKDWRTIATRHWSVRWWGAAIVLEFVNQFLPAAQPYLPVWINPIVMAALIGLCSAAGLVCKFIAQGNLSDGPA